MDKLKEALGRVSISSPSGDQYPDEDMKSQSRLSLTSVDSAVCDQKTQKAPNEEFQLKTGDGGTAIIIAYVSLPAI
jgi:hypothetical protein